jgi:hypothetical protein
MENFQNSTMKMPVRAGKSSRGIWFRTPVLMTPVLMAGRVPGQDNSPSEHWT